MSEDSCIGQKMMCKAQVACYKLSSIDFVDARLFPLEGG